MPAFAFSEGHGQASAFRFAAAASSPAVATDGSQPAYSGRQQLEQQAAEPEGAEKLS